jgi:hypothetical protein
MLDSVKELGWGLVRAVVLRLRYLREDCSAFAGSLPGSIAGFGGGSGLSRLGPLLRRPCGLLFLRAGSLAASLTQWFSRTIDGTLTKKIIILMKESRKH